MEGEVKRGVWVCNSRSKQKRGRKSPKKFFLNGEMSSKKRNRQLR